MPQISVAIDMSSRRARLAQWEATFRKVTLLDLNTVTFDAESSQAERWQRVREALPEQLDSIAVTVDSTRVSTRLLSFPFTDVRKVESAIDFELEGQVPYSLDDIVSTWVVSERGEAATRVLAALMPREPIMEQIAAMGEVGLEPRIAVAAGAVLQEVLPPELRQRTESEGPTAVLAIGGDVSHVLLWKDGVRYTRTLRAGGDDIDRAVAKAYGVSQEQGRELKETQARIVGDDPSAGSAERRMSEVLIAGLQPLLTALGTTFRALPHEELPGSLYLTGGVSRLPGLTDLFQSRLGIPVAELDVKAALGDVECRVESVEPEYATVVGLAMAQANRGRSLGLNFRRGDLAFQGDLQLYRGQIKRLAFGVAAVFLLAMVGSVLRYVMITGEEEKINSGFCSATEKIVGRRICDPTAALAAVRQTPEASDGVFIPAYSAATMYEMMSKALGSELDVIFDQLEFRLESQSGGQDRITGKGEAASFETTEKVVAALKRDPCVQGAEVSKQRKKRDSSRVEFSLGVKVSCPAGVKPGASLAAVSPSGGQGEGAGGRVPPGGPGGGNVKPRVE